MTDPLISVIVPVYNVEKYLDKCIESIVNQTYTNLEIILVDDGSPDNCPAICDKWAEKDDRIIVIHKENGGVSSARNVGLDSISGEYVGFVDADDYIEPDMYFVLYSELCSIGADVSMCGYIFEYSDKPSEKVFCDDFTYDFDIAQKYLYDEGIRSELANKLYKACLFNDVRFNSDIKYGEDMLINYFVLKKCNKVISTSECKYHYIQNRADSSTAPIITPYRAQSYIIGEIIMDDCKNDKALYEAAVYRFTTRTFAILSRVMQDEKICNDYFYEITNSLVKHKKEILMNKHIVFKYKIFISVMFINKQLFKKMVLIFRGRQYE